MRTVSLETVHLAIEDRIATVTLNRPDRMNAFDAQMIRDMIAVFDLTDSDDEVGALVVTGAGRAFSAGADLRGGADSFDYDKSSLHETVADEVENIRDGGGRLTLRIFESLKPVIAAVNGPAVGLGATMQCMMDIRIASTEARYGFVFSQRGLVPEACSTWSLLRLVGPQTALEWCFSGRVFPASEAFERGLVRSLHAPDDLLAAARSLARSIVDNAAPISVALTRQMIWRMLGSDHPMEAHKIDSRAIWNRGRGADVREGVTAFLERRPAQFSEKVSSDMPDFYPWWPDRPFA